MERVSSRSGSHKRVSCTKLPPSERVSILEFDFCSQRCRSFRSYRNISIATKASFFHIAVTNVEILKDGSKSSEINSRLFGASNIGFTYDLQQRYAGAV